MANAESIETTIFPTVIPKAMMKLLSIISQNGALFTPTPWVQMVAIFSSRCPPGISVIGVSKTALLSSVAATNATYSGNRMTAIPAISMVWLKIVSPRRFSIIGSAPYFQRSGTERPSAQSPGTSEPPTGRRTPTGRARRNLRDRSYKST